MLNLSPEKILLVLVIALVVLGPNRLPQAARTLGRVVGNLRRLSGTLQSEMHGAMAEPMDAARGVAGDLGLRELRDSLREMANPAPAAPPAPVPETGGAGGQPGPPPPDDPSFN